MSSPKIQLRLKQKKRLIVLTKQQYLQKLHDSDLHLLLGNLSQVTASRRIIIKQYLLFLTGSSNFPRDRTQLNELIFSELNRRKLNYYETHKHLLESKFSWDVNVTNITYEYYFLPNNLQGTILNAIDVGTIKIYQIHIPKMDHLLLNTTREIYKQRINAIENLDQLVFQLNDVSALKFDIEERNLKLKHIRNSSIDPKGTIQQEIEDGNPTKYGYQRGGKVWSIEFDQCIVNSKVEEHDLEGYVEEPTELDLMISTCTPLKLSNHNVLINCPNLYQNDTSINCGINTIIGWSQEQPYILRELSDLNILCQKLTHNSSMTLDQLNQRGLYLYKEFIPFMLSKNVTCYWLNNDLSIRQIFQCSRASKNYNPIVFVIDHQDMQLVKDCPERSFIVNHRETNLYLNDKHTSNQKYDETKLLKLVEEEEGEDLYGFIYQVNSLDYILQQIMNKERKMGHIIGEKLNIHSIRWTKTLTDKKRIHKVVTTQKNINECRKMAKDLDIHHTNQTLGQLLMQKLNIGDNIKSDLFNPELHDVFYLGNHNERYYYKKQLVDDLVGYDRSKCYETAFRTNTEEYCCFNGLSQIEPIDHLDGVGIYYVEIHGKIEEFCHFFHTRGIWVYRHTVQYFIKQGFEPSIKYMIRPSSTLPANFFIEYLNQIYQLMTPEDAKKYARIFIGLLRKYKYTIDSKYLVGTKTECKKFLSEHNGYFYRMRQLTYETDVDEKGSYLCCVYKKTVRHCNSLPIAHQVLENAMIHVHQLYIQMKFKLDDIVALNLDEIVIQNNPNIIMGQKNGYKIEPKDIRKRFDPKKTQELINLKLPCYELLQYNYRPQNHPIINEDKNREQIVQLITQLKQDNKGFLLDGLAGTGKSYLLKNIFPKPGYLHLSFTNQASRLIDGDTIHSYFHISVEKNNKTITKLNQIKNNEIKGICIDEVFQAPYEVLRVLFDVKQKYPNLPIYMFGDIHQCEAMGQIVRPETHFIHQLTDNNTIQLNQCYRNQDEHIMQIFKNIIEGEFKPIFKQHYEITMINLCLSNDKVNKINKGINQHLAKTKEHILIGDRYVYHGLKIICHQPLSIEEFKFKNCDHLIIKSYDKENIYFETTYKSITHKQFLDHFDLDYAITINRCQGMTINEPYSIHQWNHYYMTNNKRYTAYSRCRDEKLINIYK